jgi:hypothetical protein
MLLLVLHLLLGRATCVVSVARCSLLLPLLLLLLALRAAPLLLLSSSRVCGCCCTGGLRTAVARGACSCCRWLVLFARRGLLSLLLRWRMRLHRRLDG